MSLKVGDRGSVPSYHIDECVVVKTYPDYGTGQNEVLVQIVLPNPSYIGIPGAQWNNPYGRDLVQNECHTYILIRDFVLSTPVVAPTEVPPPPIARKVYRCVECGEENTWAEANMTNDRFICFSHRTTVGWKYPGEILQK